MGHRLVGKEFRVTKEDDQLSYYRDKLLLKLAESVRTLLIGPVQPSRMSKANELLSTATQFDSQLDQRWPLGEDTWYGEEKT